MWTRDTAKPRIRLGKARALLVRPPFAERSPKAPRRGPRAEGHTPGRRPVPAHLPVARQTGSSKHASRPPAADANMGSNPGPSMAEVRVLSPPPPHGVNPARAEGPARRPPAPTWTCHRVSPWLITALGPGVDWAGASLGRGLPRPYVGATALAPRVCCKGPCAPAAVGTRPSFMRCQPRKASGAVWEGRGARAEAPGVVTHGVERDWEGRASFGS